MNNFFKKVLASVLTMAIIISGIAVIQNKPSDVKAAVGDWELVWSDEFDGNALDTSVWSYEIGNGDWGWGNGEVQYYTNRTDNVKVSDGNLQIIAKRENYGGQKFTSGRILTKGKKAFLYGKMEARIKVENGNQSGVWPAYWMMGNNMTNGVGWPNCGEIDIMEHANDRNYVGGCLHWNYEGIGGKWDKHASYGSGDANQDYHFKDNVNNGINGWHTYGLIWDKDHMEWQVDGVTYFEQEITNNNAYCFQKEQFFLFNLAIGGTGSGFTGGQTASADFKTTTMYVDYLRVYQKEEVPTTKYDGPTVVVTDDAVESYTGNWEPWVSGVDSSWLPAEATVTSNGAAKDGFTVAATNFGRTGGDSVWTIQGQLLNMKYYAGATYTYKCTIESDVDKKVYVKVTNEGDENLAGGYIDVKAGVPYNYSVNYTVPEDYTDAISLKFGFGKTDGDTIPDNASGTIKVSNLSFATTTSIPDPEYTQPATTKPPVPQTTTKNVIETPTKDKPVETTVIAPQVDKNKTLSRAKIKSITRSKNNKKAKIKINRVKGANGYQIRYSIKKNFKNKTTKSVKIKRLSKTIKNLKTKKKYYIQVRAYAKNRSKNVFYGKWSKVKVLKVRQK